ncbi:Plasmodium exported protein, unknown function [Plasmodium ovale wallikeri]|uniref:Uncharacterized protein n=1 Tax=Plasmodium ovale wallikeri TaxID=864142 RepID=A0A1A8YH58_PLAOA|nr:Plasmodium exported protein, unknown function [Plasmodium ovale wallikeri]
MEKIKFNSSKNGASNDDVPSLKSTRSFIPCSISNSMKCCTKENIKKLQNITKICLYLLVIWILNCPDNSAYFNKHSYDGYYNNETSSSVGVIRSLAQVDVMRMTTYDTPYCKPWDRNCDYRIVPQKPQRMVPHEPHKMPPHGPHKMPPHGPHKMPPHGPHRIPPHGPHRIPPHGPHRIPPHGPHRIPPHGPHRMPPHGPRRMPPHGPRRIPPYGPRRMPPHGPRRIPEGVSQKMLPGIPRDMSPDVHKGMRSIPYVREYVPEKHGNKENMTVEPYVNEKVSDPTNVKCNSNGTICRVEVRQPGNDQNDDGYYETNMKMFPIDNTSKTTTIRAALDKFKDLNACTTDIANSLMSNITDVQLERNPALELIKENVIDHVIAANEGVIKNIGALKENIATTLKTIDEDLKPPIELIKETLLDKIGSIEPNMKPKLDEIKDVIVDTITTNIECGVKPTIDNIKLSVLDKIDDINAGVTPKINDLKDTIKGKIENIEYDVIPKIGTTIKGCINDKIEDITTGIKKETEALKGTVVNNVKSIYNGDVVPQNLKDIASKISYGRDDSIENAIIKNVGKSALGFSLFEGVRNRIKNIGDKTKSILSFTMSVLFALGGLTSFVLNQHGAAGIILIFAVIFAYYGVYKLVRKSIFSKFPFKRKKSKKKSEGQ